MSRAAMELVVTEDADWQTFSFHTCRLSFANSLRRVMIADIPTVGEFLGRGRAADSPAL